MTVVVDNNPTNQPNGNNTDNTHSDRKVSYANAGFRDDEGVIGIKKPHREITDEEAEAQHKFKVSKKETWRVLKNVTAISAAFMVQFTAFQGT